MRPLAQGPYSEEEARAVLFAPNLRVGSKFTVLDRDGSGETELPVGDDGVLVDGASVEWNVDQEIISQLRCRMRPVEVLRGSPLTKLLRVSFVAEGPKGPLEYRLGEFVWTSPNRDVWPGDEWWDVVAGDKSHLLDLGGPGRDGFSAAKDSFLHTAVNRCLAAAGFPANCPTLDVRLNKHFFRGLTSPRKVRKWQSDYQRFLSQSRPAVNSKGKPKPRTGAQKKAQQQAKALGKKLLTWTVENAPTTWLTVINDLCQMVGFSFFFDYDGLPRVVPSRDLANASPDFVFECSESGIVQSRIATSTDYESIANRVFVKLADDARQPLVVDANTVMPWHPLAESKVGVFIDAVVNQDTDLGSAPALAQGKKRLFESGGAYESLRWDALLHPGLEPFDVWGLNVPGDPEFSVTAACHGRQCGFDLGGGLMTVEGHRVFAP